MFSSSVRLTSLILFGRASRPKHSIYSPSVILGAPSASHHNKNRPSYPSLPPTSVKQHKFSPETSFYYPRHPFANLSNLRNYSGVLATANMAEKMDTSTGFSRLPTNAVPSNYAITLKPNFLDFTFEGSQNVDLAVSKFKLCLF